MAKQKYMEMINLSIYRNISHGSSIEPVQLYLNQKIMLKSIESMPIYSFMELSNFRRIAEKK